MISKAEAMGETEEQGELKVSEETETEAEDDRVGEPEEGVGLEGRRTIIG